MMLVLDDSWGNGTCDPAGVTGRLSSGLELEVVRSVPGPEWRPRCVLTLMVGAGGKVVDDVLE